MFHPEKTVELSSDLMVTRADSGNAVNRATLPGVYDNDTAAASVVLGCYQKCVSEDEANDAIVMSKLAKTCLHRCTRIENNPNRSTLQLLKRVPFLPHSPGQRLIIFVAGLVSDG